MDSVEVSRWTQDLGEHLRDLSFARFVQISKCSVCKDITVWKFTWVDGLGENIGEQRLYPTQRDHSSLPTKVRSRLEAADRVRALDPGLYAVAVRRLLETVFNEQGAEGRDLYAKVQDLVAKDRLPSMIADAASRLRELGKYGAHDEEIEVCKDDVPAIEDLANAILEYVYRAPATIAALEESVIERGGRITFDR